MAILNQDEQEPVSTIQPTHVGTPTTVDFGTDSQGTGIQGPNPPPGTPILNPDILTTAPEGPDTPGTPNLPLPPTPNGGGIIDPATAQTATADTATPIDEGNLSGVPLGPTDAVTREVQDEELVANQMEGLLSGDSKFIQNARRRAAELSNRRGQFTSNLFGGAAERAAIESALPIAQNDAQAFRDAASQNLVARNQNAIANIQRAAQLDTALISSRTQTSLANLDAATRVSIANMDTLARIDIANLDAGTRTKIANMNNATSLLLQDMQGQLELTMQGRSMEHDSAMEEYRQNGRLQLANIDGNLRKALTAAGFEHDVNMQNLSAADALKLNTVLQEYDLEKQQRDQGFNDRQSHINMAMQAQVNYINYLSSFAGTEMDANAASRLQAQADQQLQATFSMINGLYPNQPAIAVQFGNVGG